MSRIVRVIALGLLVLALSNALHAVPRNQSLRVGPRAESGDLAVTVWKWLLQVFTPSPEPTENGASSARSKEGSQLDPDGHH